VKTNSLKILKRVIFAALKIFLGLVIFIAAFFIFITTTLLDLLARYGLYETLYTNDSFIEFMHNNIVLIDIFLLPLLFYFTGKFICRNKRWINVGLRLFLILILDVLVHALAFPFWYSTNLN